MHILIRTEGLSKKRNSFFLPSQHYSLDCLLRNKWLYGNASKFAILLERGFFDHKNMEHFEAFL